jgi:hypothetical protein
MVGFELFLLCRCGGANRCGRSRCARCARSLCAISEERRRSNVLDPPPTGVGAMAKRPLAPVIATVSAQRPKQVGAARRGEASMGITLFPRGRRLP